MSNRRLPFQSHLLRGCKRQPQPSGQACDACNWLKECEIRLLGSEPRDVETRFQKCDVKRRRVSSKAKLSALGRPTCPERPENGCDVAGRADFSCTLRQIEDQPDGPRSELISELPALAASRLRIGHAGHRIHLSARVHETGSSPSGVAHARAERDGV